MKTILPLFLAICAIFNALSAQPTVLKDVFPGTTSSNPKSLVAFKGKLHFLATNSATSQPRIFNSDLTAGGTNFYTSVGASVQIVSNLLPSQKAATSTNFADNQLFFATKRLANGANIFELYRFDGSANPVLLADLSNTVANSGENSPIASVDLSYSLLDNFHVNPVTKQNDGDAYYSEFRYDDNGSVDYKWTQRVDVGVEAFAFPLRTLWVFAKNFRDDREKIRSRDDNGQGSTTTTDQLSDDVVGLGGVEDANKVARFMFFSRLNNVSRLKIMTFNRGFDGERNVEQSNPLDFEVLKAGFLFRQKLYFTTTKGIYQTDFDFNAQPLIGFPTNNTTVNSLTLTNNRAFFIATTTDAPNGGLYEILDDATTRLMYRLNAGEVCQKIFSAGVFTFAVTKNGTQNSFYRLDANRAVNVGSAVNVDVAAGFFYANNTLVFSANNPTDNVGQELYKLTLPTIACDGDRTPPDFLNCPRDTTIFNATAAVNVTWTEPTAVDNCGNPSVLKSKNPNSSFPIGVTQVIYTATDAAGLKGFCSFFVNVANSCGTLPTFQNCPTTRTAQTATDSAVVTWTEPTIQNASCGAFFLTKNFSSGAKFPLGLTNVAYLATNLNGSSLCSFSVVVVNTATICATDTIKPVFKNCPRSFKRFGGAGQDLQTIVNLPTATDNCTQPPTITANVNGNFIPPVGTTIVNFTAKDAKNNQANCTFSITVVDNNCVSKIVNRAVKTCVPSEVGVKTQDFSTAFGCDSVVVTTTTLKRSDSLNRNETICAGNNVKIGTQTFSTSGKFTVKLVNTEGCDSVIVLNLTVNRRDTTRFTSTTCLAANVGSDTTRLTNRLGCDSLVVRSRVFSTTDTVKPEWRNCPTNQNFTIDTSRACQVATWATPTATDNCTTNLTLQNSHNSGFCFLKNTTTTVVYTATDARGNVATCTFSISVVDVCSVDTVKPTILNCPVSQTVKTPTNCATVNWTQPTATDNCRLLGFNSNFRSGDCFPIGTTTVTYSATDARNNFATCRFTITVSFMTNSTAQPEQNVSKMHVEPNPTEGSFSVVFDSPIAQFIVFNFYNALGQHIRQDKKLVLQGANRLFFDIKNLPKGLFWLLPILDGRALSVVRVVKI